ncbi:hypothetical protein ITG13_15995 [Vibrio cyclitrophicus]|nr:HEPN domain-containing protein [Vibrio cyclitrophicus]UPR49986.1 hypothetical protein ITG13_15995 [Vibrio cyclitrophicus]
MYQKFMQGDPVSFTKNSLKDNQLIAKLIQDTKCGNHTVNLTSPQYLICGTDVSTIKLSHEDDNISLELSLNVNKSSARKVEGVLSRLSYSSSTYKISKLVYILPNSGERHFVHNNLSWESNQGCSFRMFKDRVEVMLPRVISSDEPYCEELNNQIDEQIKILGSMLTFCRSTTVEWESKYSFNEDKQVAFEYIKSRSKEKFSNQINPMRRDEKTWKEFLLHCMTSNLTMKELIDSGVYQAIANLRMTPVIDEWSLIRLVAALEGLVSQNETIIPQKLWKTLRRDFVTKVKLTLSSNTQQINIDKIINNINNSDRIINQQSLKNRVKYLMEELQLTSYYKREEDSINKVINTRNKIVHNGWDRDLDEPIWDMIVTMRNANYLLVISKLNYQGSFWFCFENEKQTLEMNR